LTATPTSDNTQVTPASANPTTFELTATTPALSENNNFYSKLFVAL
jgi:hypothetical protein